MSKNNNGVMIGGVGADGVIQYDGELLTRRHHVRFKLVPNDKNSSRDPDFLIVERSPHHNQLVRIGTAWKNEVKQGPNTGKTLFSMNFSDDDFGSGLRVTAFFDRRQNGEDHFHLSLDRRRESRDAVSSEQEAA